MRRIDYPIPSRIPINTAIEPIVYKSERVEIPESVFWTMIHRAHPVAKLLQHCAKQHSCYYPRASTDFYRPAVMYLTHPVFTAIMDLFDMTALSNLEEDIRYAGKKHPTLFGFDKRLAEVLVQEDAIP